MREIERCLVCDGSVLSELYPATFSGTWRQAAPYFLTHRVRAVRGRTVRCVRCGFVLTSPQFDPSEYDEIYASLRGGSERLGSSERRFRELGRRVRSFRLRGRLLDFGCRDEAFLRTVPELDGIGFDVCDRPSLSWRERVAEGRLESLVAHVERSGERFDVITAWDVFEHVPRLLETVGLLRGLLARGGLLFCSVPDISSLAARLGGRNWNCMLLEHLWYFEPKTLSAFAGRCELRAIEISTLPFWADFGALEVRIRQSVGFAPRLPARVAKMSIPFPAGLIFAVFERAEKAA